MCVIALSKGIIMNSVMVTEQPRELMELLSAIVFYSMWELSIKYSNALKLQYLSYLRHN